MMIKVLDYLLCFSIVDVMSLTCLSFLQVRWDDDAGSKRKNRVSPWEIKPSSSTLGSSNSSLPGSKRTKFGMPSVEADFPVPSMSFHHCYCRNALSLVAFVRRRCQSLGFCTALS